MNILFFLIFRYSDGDLTLIYPDGSRCSTGFQRMTIINFECKATAGEWQYSCCEYYNLYGYCINNLWISHHLCSIDPIMPVFFASFSPVQISFSCFSPVVANVFVPICALMGVLVRKGVVLRHIVCVLVFWDDWKRLRHCWIKVNGAGFLSC